VTRRVRRTTRAKKRAKVWRGGARQKRYIFARAVVSDLQSRSSKLPGTGSPQTKRNFSGRSNVLVVVKPDKDKQGKIMATKPTIKIIKRKERAAQVAASEEVAVKKTAPEAARDMVATVSEWVSEFQQRRRDETTQALKMLTSNPASRLTEA
jgi:hypothetical protein